MIEAKAARKFVKIMPSEQSVSTEQNLLKKATTKIMITDALRELKTRKGVSVQAIKKFMSEKYQADTEKLNFIIKKTLKSGVEDGTFQQLKGIGASGSFKLINTKEKKVKKPKSEKQSEKKPKEKSEKKLGEKSKMKAAVKQSSLKEKLKKEKKVTDTKKEKQKLPKTKKEGSESTTKTVKKQKIEKSQVKVVKEKPKKKMAKGLAVSQGQDTSIIRRKSIGSIIKPPKMKPKRMGPVK